MSSDGTSRGEGHHFIDSLGRLFGGGRERAAEPEPAEPKADLGALAADFEAALGALDQRVAEQQRASKKQSFGRAGPSETDRTAERQARQKLAHRTMREDIEKMHERLRTGFKGSDLDALVSFLQDLQKLSSAGAGSHALLPRARHAIAERLRTELGEVAVARLVAALQRQGIGWPDPTQSHPKATPEEIESSRRRRLSELRENFLTYDFARIAERLQGVVSGWGGDYPERGSALWEESVLKGVAAAIWARLLQDCVELLKEKQKQLLSQAEEVVGKELAALHAAVERSSASVMQTTEAIASSLRVIDQVVPELAWQLVRPTLDQPGEGSMD